LLQIVLKLFSEELMQSQCGSNDSFQVGSNHFAKLCDRSREKKFIEKKHCRLALAKFSYGSKYSQVKQVTLKLADRNINFNTREGRNHLKSVFFL